MKKRIFALLLTICLVVSAFSGPAQGVLAEEGSTGTSTTVEGLGYDRETLTVSTFTPLTGNFFTDMWGTGTSDGDVKKLLHGYPLTKYDVASRNYISNDDAVSGMQITKDKNGNRVFNIFLCDDLYYSDGSKITAYDYAFSILLQLSPAVAQIGADRPNLDYILGASAYYNGKSEYISGVRVLSDNQLRITINKNAFPYYYELSYVAFNPYPISVIAPYCKVTDSSLGVKIEGTFDRSVVKQGILAKNKGYLTHPQVVSGPYTLKSFDGTKAIFSLNTYYKGSDQATIKTIEYTSATADKVTDDLKTGKTGLVNKAMNTAAVTSLTGLLGDGTYMMSSYPRSGMSMISFCCENPRVAEKAVRKAISMCLDKEGLKTAAVGEYGTVVKGYYGIGQWMYQYVSGAEPYPTEDGVELSKWQQLNLDNVKTYSFDPEGAAKVLEDAGWTLNDSGIREKKVNKKTVQLSLTLVVGEGNSAVDFLKNDFAAALQKAGIKLTVKTMAWSDMLKLYYREQERDCDMFFLATNFSENFDPASWFSTKDEDQGVGNKTGLANEILYQTSRKLVKTDPNDTVGYCTKWVAFLESVSENIPVIPVYSNVYFDFYTGTLNGYDPSIQISWADGIYGVSLQDLNQ